MGHSDTVVIAGVGRWGQEHGREGGDYTAMVISRRFQWEPGTPASGSV